MDTQKDTLRAATRAGLKPPQPGLLPLPPFPPPAPGLLQEQLQPQRPGQAAFLALGSADASHGPQPGLQQSAVSSCLLDVFWVPGCARGVLAWLGLWCNSSPPLTRHVRSCH